MFGVRRRLLGMADDDHLFSGHSIFPYLPSPGEGKQTPERSFRQSCFAHALDHVLHVRGVFVGEFFR
jgi:hypothetical protein